MGLSSLRACNESSPDHHWLQGTIQKDSSGREMMSTCSTRPTTEPTKRLGPPPDQAQNKCPRCDSTHTKFCYYNNYSLSQPRYLCKSCRRYWTKGGSLRNIPVGGTCRSKNNSKKPNKSNNPHQQPHTTTNQNPIESSYQDVQFSHINPNFMLENPRFGEGIIGSSRNFDLFGVSSVGSNNVLPQNYQGLCYSSVFEGMPSLSNSYNIMDQSSCQRLMMLPPYDDSSSSGDQNSTSMIVSPFNGGYNLNGAINGYGSSTTNPLIWSSSSYTN